MPTRDELLKDLVIRVAALEVEIDRLRAEADWEADVGFDPRLAYIEPTDQNELQGLANIAEVSGHQLAVTLPDDWDDYNADQRTAYLAVLADGGNPTPREPPSEIITIDLAGGAGAEFPKPSPEALAIWDETADAICENITISPEKGTALLPADAARYYRIGGPLWLSAYDHEFLMGLPQYMRTKMVESVLTYAPKDAADLGRAILKADTESAKGAAYDQALDHADKRPTAHR